MKLVSGGLIGLVRLYQYAISPLMPPHCRFYPSCSHYACDALRSHGPVRGSWLTLVRLTRCHPWGGEGYDPVPEPEHRVSGTDKGFPTHHHCQERH